jgi:hypothetical protein
MVFGYEDEHSFKRRKMIRLLMTGILLMFSFGGFGQGFFIPVSLSSPMDFDTIIQTEPTFVWQTNLSAIVSDPRYSQRFVLCHLGEDQTKSEAIDLNQPLQVLEDFPNTVYTYSSSSSPLEFGNTYVWQVSILFNGLVMNASEIFQFTLAEPLDTLPRFYPVVFKNDGQHYTLHNGKIGLVTDELGDLQLGISIYKDGLLLQGNYLKEYLNGALQSVTVSTGAEQQRFFVLDIDSLDLDAGFYKVIWSPKSKKEYTFNFEID